jgi:hypothetical protein
MKFTTEQNSSVAEGMPALLLSWLTMVVVLAVALVHALKRDE